MSRQTQSWDSFRRWFPSSASSEALTACSRIRRAWRQGKLLNLPKSSLTMRIWTYQHISLKSNNRWPNSWWERRLPSQSNLSPLTKACLKSTLLNLNSPLHQLSSRINLDHSLLLGHLRPGIWFNWMHLLSMLMRLLNKRSLLLASNFMRAFRVFWS